MGRTTRANKKAVSPKKTTQRTRSQKSNAKPKTSPRPSILPKTASKVTIKKDQLQMNATTSNKCQPDVSPRIFDSPLIQTYQGLQYESKSSDSFKSCVCSLLPVDGSRDLFETESLEAKIKLESPVQMVSIGIQCTLLTETQDVSVGTDGTTLRDSGVQTSPQPSTFDIYTSVQSHSIEEEDLFQSCSSDHLSEGSPSEADSSDDTLRDFDMLENYDDPITSVTRFNSLQPEGNAADESESRVSDSPPQNRIYINRSFHSPDSSQIRTKPSQP